MDQTSRDAIAKAHLRIARPTNQLAALVAFYTDVLGFHELGRFEDHEGFDGVMLGHSLSGYHLEFTQANSRVPITEPDPDQLLVFYLPDRQHWENVVTWIESRGVLPVASSNPYWDRNGRTYSDPDRFRFVIQHGRWT